MKPNTLPSSVEIVIGRITKRLSELETHVQELQEKDDVKSKALEEIYKRAYEKVKKIEQLEKKIHSLAAQRTQNGRNTKQTYSRK